MTLHEFLNLVDTTPESELRLAMTLALVGEIPHTQEQYSRFYDRVLTRTRDPTRVGQPLRRGVVNRSGAALAESLSTPQRSSRRRWA